MSKRKYQLLKRALTPEEQAKVAAGVKQAELDRPAIIARGRELLRSLPSAALQQVFVRLKEERLRQGLTLAEVEDRTGIGAPALSRLENPETSNPTIETVCRVAQALGKRVKIELEDAK